MQITNRNGLPKQFEQVAQSFYKYKEKQYSATAIIGSVREIILKRRHHDEIEQDVSDMIWALMGQGLHSILENYSEQDDELAEEYLKVKLDNGYTLSGRFDLYNASNKMIIDYKTVSVWSVIYESNIDHWRKQLLIYAWLLRKTGFEVERAQIIALMRDWQKAKAKVDKSYPQLQVKTFDFYFKESDFVEIEQYIYSRFDEIIAAEKLPDSSLPACSDEERWFTGDKYAVKKKGNKRALRVYDSVEEAERHVNNATGDQVLEIEKRVGEHKKCENYCSAAPFCNFYNQYVKGDQADE